MQNSWFLVLLLRLQLRQSNFNLTHGGPSSGRREWMRSPAKQQLCSMELWYNSSYSSSSWLQNKLVSIDKPEAERNPRMEPGEAAWVMAIAPCTSPAFKAGWLGRMPSSHEAPNPLKMQPNGNQASAQQDVSDSCHQAEGTNFVSCHSDSGD